jgi:hypothetical protein
MVIARFAGRSQWLSGAKKTPGRDCSEGCPKFPVSGQPSNGEGSLPCRLFPPDFLCQALRKSTCVKLQNQDPKISNHTDRLNATAYEAQPAITAVKDQKRTFPDSFWGFAASAGRPGAPTLFFSSAGRVTGRAVSVVGGAPDFRSAFSNASHHLVDSGSG